MKHLKQVSDQRIPKVASSLPFSKCCMMAGGRLEDAGDTCVTSSEASQALFELFAGIKGVPYS